jgi:Txe/YoeB family toxin of Txe-Axe toxin-antitoxin module
MKLEFDPYALEDFRHWVATDRKRVPKTLKRILAGCWPQLVDQTHRLVYKLEDDTAVILSCRYHY